MHTPVSCGGQGFRDRQETGVYKTENESAKWHTLVANQYMRYLFINGLRNLAK